jgi:hypothetical protein
MQRPVAHRRNLEGAFADPMISIVDPKGLSEDRIARMLEGHRGIAIYVDEVQVPDRKSQDTFGKVIEAGLKERGVRANYVTTTSVRQINHQVDFSHCCALQFDCPGEWDDSSKVAAVNALRDLREASKKLRSAQAER